MSAAADTEESTMANRQREYAISLSADVAHLDAFEDALDLLPAVAEPVVIGGGMSDVAALVFTVTGYDPLNAVYNAQRLLADHGIAIPNGSSLSILEHAA